MAEIRRARRLSLPLLLLCVLLGYVVYIQAEAALPLPPEPRVTAAPAGDAAAPPVEPEFSMPPLENFAETLARPLFMDTRRPPEPGTEPVALEPESVPEPPKPTPKLVGVELSGIVITPSSRVALIRGARGREVVRITEGEEFAGWTVETIDPDRVVLRQDDVFEELTLKDKVGRKRARPPREAGTSARDQTQPAPRTARERSRRRQPRPSAIVPETFARPPAATLPAPE